MISTDQTAAALLQIAGYIEEQLNDERADRQVALENAQERLSALIGEITTGPDGEERPVQVPAPWYGRTYTVGADGTARDARGRLDPADAVAALIDSIPPGPPWNRGRPVNKWTAAELATEAADEGTVRAALSRLLALHLHNNES
jgi:hypothetical protein